MRIVAASHALLTPPEDDCKCSHCMQAQVSRSRSGYILVESDPICRTVAYESHPQVPESGNIRDGLYHLKLPYMRSLIGVSYEPTANYGSIYVYGSLNTFSGLSENVFVMPLPNIDIRGYLTCAGSMSTNWQATVQGLAKSVLTAFWNTRFSYWVGTRPGMSGHPYKDFKVLQGGLATLKTIQAIQPIVSFVSVANNMVLVHEE